MKKQKQLHCHCTERISLLWLSVFISEHFSWEAQKLTLENSKLAKPSPWKVGTASIRVINFLPNQVNTTLIPSPGCGWLSSPLDLAIKSKAFWLRTDELGLRYGHILTEDGRVLRLLQHQGFQHVSPPEHGAVNAIQKKLFFTHTDMYVYIIEKTTILFSEMSEHFGLSLLENTPRQTPRIEHFSQKFPLPQVTASLQRCQAARHWRCQPYPMQTNPPFAL